MEPVRRLDHLGRRAVDPGLDPRRLATRELAAPYVLERMAEDAVGLLDELRVERAPSSAPRSAG